MRFLLQFLIISLKTVDGIRGSAISAILELSGFKHKKETKADKFERMLENKKSPFEVATQNYITENANT